MRTLSLGTTKHPEERKRFLLPFSVFGVNVNVYVLRDCPETEEILCKPPEKIHTTVNFLYLSTVNIFSSYDML